MFFLKSAKFLNFISIVFKFKIKTKKITNKRSSEKKIDLFDFIRVI